MGAFAKMITAKGMMWTLCKLRKPSTCALTGMSLKAGDYAYRPITNGADRMQRIKPLSIHRLQPPSPHTEE